MIRALLGVLCLQLARDRGSLLLTFLLPLVFFSVFAAVFSQMDGGTPAPLEVAVIVDDPHPLGGAVGRRVAAAPGLAARVADGPEAAAAVRRGFARGDFTALVTVPDGFGVGLSRRDPATPALIVEIDRAHPVASAMLPGLVEAAAGRAASEAGSTAPPTGASDALSVTVREGAGRAGRQVSVAFYASGLGVMFLLFSMAMRAGVVIDERESGLTARQRAAGVGPFTASFARWLYLAALGTMQLTVMFVWAALAFGLAFDTVDTIAGATVMVLASAAAGAAFGLLLAEACGTRGQLTALATTLILVMSAVGGSMVPRFLMPPRLVEAGYLTLNAWAVDGFHKVFWYARPPAALWPEVCVLSSAGAACFLLAAVIGARRSPV